MERLWFSIFNSDDYKARYWFDECAKKTLDIKTFEEALDDFATAFDAANMKSDKIEKLLPLARSVHTCCKALNGLIKNNGVDYEGQDYYHFFSEGEHTALALSRLLLSIFSDLQKRYVDGPTIARI